MIDHIIWVWSEWLYMYVYVLWWFWMYLKAVFVKMILGETLIIDMVMFHEVDFLVFSLKPRIFTQAKIEQWSKFCFWTYILLWVKMELLINLCQPNFRSNKQISAQILYKSGVNFSQLLKIRKYERSSNPTNYTMQLK